MIKLKEIQIDTFKLLKDTAISLEGKSGIVMLQGNNLDSPQFESNSVGKSTLPDAILQGLFGKNLHGTTIEKVGELYPKQKPSTTISLEMNGVDYTVKNDYDNNVLKVYKEGALLDFTAVLIS